jgi:uncharacterized protein YjbI with pentapeptide repeats
MHLVMLTEKAKDYDQALREQIGADNPTSDKLRRQLPSNIFIQYLAGPSNLRKSAFGYALGFVAWTTLVIAPMLLLLMMQLQFLPFHSSFITWTERVVLILDLALIWWLWGTIRSGRETEGNHGPLFWIGRSLGLSVGVALTIGAILFSAAVATFPGEWQEDHLPSARILPMIEAARVKTSWNGVKTSEKNSLHDWIFYSPLDGVTRHRLLPFANTLVLIDFNVLEGLHIDDPKKEDWRDFIFRARGRDLKGARFDFASLPKVDFTGAHLEEASFASARLKGAALDDAWLQSASLDFVHLQGASLNGAKLQGASLDGAELQGASLDGAELQGASLFGAELQGASLYEAQLQGAPLPGAQLQAAVLSTAQLPAATLSNAKLQGASLDGAELQGADFRGANLDAADLSDAFLWRADGGVESGKNLEIADAVWGPVWVDFAGPKRAQQPWDKAAYQNLLRTIEGVPAGMRSDWALERIGRLDCDNSDKALAPCDATAPLPPPGVTGFQSAASEGDYRKALAAELKSIVCGGDDNSIFVLLGVSRGLVGPTSSTLAAVGTEAQALIDYIMTPACPVSSKLTDDDRATLQMIKQSALKKQGG